MQRQMSQIQQLKNHFQNPSAEYSVFPFWFLNGDLNKEEISKQLSDFKSKGVLGVVAHPRIGIPEDIEYLGPKFMDIMQFIMEESTKLGMKVIIYDEGMYPSGSAHGKVVENNPEYAARGLRMALHSASGFTQMEEELADSEEIVLAVAVKFIGKSKIDPLAIIPLEVENNRVSFEPTEPGDWSMVFLISTFSKGTVRGIHFGEDDGEPGAPPAGDLLNPDAMQKFIRVTHDVYYEHLKEYFGNTIEALFTDEPSVVGRCVDTEKIKPWTIGFLDYYQEHGNESTDLLSLWFDVGVDTNIKRRNFKKAVNKRLQETYYRPISEWCERHGIQLTGHPETSDDIGFLKYFQLPGQDLVWRWVGPEDNKGIIGRDSTLGKCSSDAARHRGLPRNANEVFGCCGPNGHQWQFSVDDMKWFVDWLFVRGVNKLYPHAFYYSIDGERLNERAPDNGPHNAWWKYYKKIADYERRMSWLLSECSNVTEIAVLCEEDHIPWKIAEPLYTHQIEFNYLEEELFLHDCVIEEGKAKIKNQSYRVLILENLEQLASNDLVNKLNLFLETGGAVIAYNPEKKNLSLSGRVIQIYNYNSVIGAIDRVLFRDVYLAPNNPGLRVTHIVKEGFDFYVLVNEDEHAIEGELAINGHGAIETWDAWNSRIEEIQIKAADDIYTRFPISLQRRESAIICVNSEGAPAFAKGHNESKPIITVQVDNWILTNPFWHGEPLETLVSLTELEEMKYFSGESIYESNVTVDSINEYKKAELDLGEVCELAELNVNGKNAGVKMWSPYLFDITPYMDADQLSIKVTVTNSKANEYAKESVKSGLIGPVTLKLYT
ncbi:glycosylhydrolase-like jelly roll fold domain-containing protein [Neobacillus muris]|uniref:glycosylhydrolase-like jelly roll fold domain-containing protein n=1 Tax=Neobacillus muris TaxID=2941334 RepID=UPI00203AB6B5|nr:glycosyl hydrolase [Neobacillus muris]